MDDVHSIAHVILGILSYFFPIIFIIFIFYEVAEFMYKQRRGEERPQNLMGDVLEFCLGVSAASLSARVGL